MGSRRAEWWRFRPTSRDWLLGCGLALYSGLWWCLLIATAPHDDPFDASLHWVSWIAIIGVAAVAGYLRRGSPRPLIWAIALTVPGLVAVFLVGTVFFDPDGGASLWIVGELFVLVQGTLAWVAAIVGAAAPKRGR